MREGGSSPDDAEAGWYCQTARARLARRRGVRKEPVVEPPQERWTGSNLVDRGRDGSATDPPYNREGRPWAGLGLVQGATVKACGVTVDGPAGEKLGTDPVDRSVVNVGTVFLSPTCRPARLAAARHVVC